jgi:hypothetical protein
LFAYIDNQAVRTIAHTVQFLGSPERATSHDAAPPVVAHAAPGDDDIPF